MRFRNLLSVNAGLRRAYEMERRKVLVRGITHGLEYAKATGDFIPRMLNADRF